MLLSEKLMMFRSLYSKAILRGEFHLSETARNIRMTWRNADKYAALMRKMSSLAITSTCDTVALLIVCVLHIQFIIPRSPGYHSTVRMTQQNTPYENSDFLMIK
jgi:hypothetical protein